jgi:hypothetical protein
VVPAFVRLRQLLATHADLARKLEELEQRYDHQFKQVFVRPHVSRSKDQWCAARHGRGLESFPCPSPHGVRALITPSLMVGGKCASKSRSGRHNVAASPLGSWPWFCGRVGSISGDHAALDRADPGARSIPSPAGGPPPGRAAGLVGSGEMGKTSSTGCPQLDLGPPYPF